MLISVKKASELLNVHPDTLRRWEKLGFINASRSKGNHRRYDKDQIEAMIVKPMSTDAVFCACCKKRINTMTIIEEIGLQRTVELRNKGWYVDDQFMIKPEDIERVALESPEFALRLKRQNEKQ